jgi:hypothetical protein
MVVALRDVRVRGEIHTIIDYAVDMLTSQVRAPAGAVAPSFLSGLALLGGVGEPSGRARPGLRCACKEGCPSPLPCKLRGLVGCSQRPPAQPRTLLPPPPLPPLQEFTQNHIHTGWLDSRIAANVKAERPPWHLCVIGSAVGGARALKPATPRLRRAPGPGRRMARSPARLKLPPHPS